MQQEKQFRIPTNSDNSYTQLASLLVLFLHSPTPQTQHRLTLFHPDVYLSIITNPAQEKKIRQASCSALKALVNNRALFQSHFQQTLQKIEFIYFSNNQKEMSPIWSSFEIILQKIFNLYFDDQKRLKAFEEIMQKVGDHSTLDLSHIALRGLHLALILMRAMDILTVNNQVCIGQLICYLKQIYYDKNRTQNAKSFYGMGTKLLYSAMSEQNPSAQLSNFVETQLKVIEFIQQLLQKVQDQNDDGDPIPFQYIKNSRQIQSLLSSIISINFDGQIYCKNENINKFKAMLLQLFSAQYIYHIEQPFLIVCLSTVSKCSASDVTDEIDTIMAQVVQLLERSTSYGDYNQLFYNNTHLLVLKLFELSSVKLSEVDAMENDPEYFAEISDDFCRAQESDSVKIRSGSLLYNLCLTIDGNLSFIVKMALLPILFLEKQIVKRLFLDGLVRQVISTQNELNAWLQLWPSKSIQTLTQVSLLVLCCISDLVAKREELYIQLANHLRVMHQVFKQRDKVLLIFHPIILVRYIQLFSYISFPGCLDNFLHLYTIKPLYAQMLLKALQTLVQCHNKKDPAMCNYVARISTIILIMGNKLTAQLQQTIIARPELILPIKEKLVQKLVVWLLDYYQDQNLFGCNKISNLLVIVIKHYPSFMIGTQQNGDNFDLIALTQYLTPLYKCVTTTPNGAVDCIIDVAVQHIECLGVTISMDIANKFVYMGIGVVQGNSFILGKNIELFSRLLSVSSICKINNNKIYENMMLMNLQIGRTLLPKVIQWINLINVKDMLFWQMLYLLQIVLTTLIHEKVVTTSLNYSKLIQICNKSSTSDIVRIKIYIISMILLIINPESNNQVASFLITKTFPLLIPPFQKKIFAIFILRMVNLCYNQKYKAYLIGFALYLINPPQKYAKYLKQYHQSIYVRNNQNAESEIYAFETTKNVLHPFDNQSTDIYKQLRKMYNQIQDWDLLKPYLQPYDQNMLREVLPREIVGSKTRKILHVKK